VAIGSAVAFLTAQLLDVAIFDRLRGRAWWRAPFVSTLVGSSVDTALFFTIAFWSALVWIEPGNDVAWANAPTAILGLGPEAPLWISLAIADWGVKLALAIVALLPFRMAIARWAARIA
jgi:hypothetical protein